MIEHIGRQFQEWADAMRDYKLMDNKTHKRLTHRITKIFPYGEKQDASPA